MRASGARQRGACRLFAVITALAAPLAAQVDTGAISGFVKDPRHSGVSDALIRIAEPVTGRSVDSRTDKDGYYSVPDLKPGVYAVSAEAPGFETVTQTGVEVRVQDRLAVDFELPVSRVASSVTIHAEAPVLDSETSSLGWVMGQREIQELPLNGRNYIELGTLVPGTFPSLRSDERNSFVANGARPLQNSYLLDGIDNKNKILGIDSSTAQSLETNLDAVQEFKIQTGAYSAEFGQSAGAVVNVTIRSGTNSLHGTLFEFLRNSAVDARPYFQPPAGANPALEQNQFGATLGGPFIRNHTFFFFGWESQREVNAAPQLASVPTEEEREGVFPVAIFDPATTARSPGGNSAVRSPFANNTIPASRWDPVAAQIAALYPLPNLDGPLNFFSNQQESISSDQFIGRMDQRFSDRDTMFGHFTEEAGTIVEPSVLPPPASLTNIASPETHSFAAGETHIFRHNLINEARVGYQETREQQAVPGGQPTSSYGIPGVPDYPNVTGLPSFSIAGLSLIGTTGPGQLPTPEIGSPNVPVDKQGRTIQANENLAWVHGSHTVKTGIDFQQVTLYGQAALGARPTFGFTGTYTQDPQNRGGTGSGFADFLLGESSSALVSTLANSEIRQHIFQAYVQDDWKVNPRLTLNLGVRYELPMPFYSTSSNYADLVLAPGPLYGTLLDAHNLGGTGYRDSFADPNWHNIAPRVGFALRPTGKIVIRSAFGVFFGRDENIGLARRLTNNPPYYIQETLVGTGVKPALTLSDGFPAGILDPGSETNPVLESMPKHAPTPYVQQWMFNVQRELPGNLLAQAIYVGSSAHDLYYPDQINTPSPGSGTVQSRRPIQGAGAIYDYGPWISSNYESLQASLERRFGLRLNLIVAYTWSHSIDNGDNQNDLNIVPPQNPLDLAAERGNASFDIRQRIVGSWVYEVPGFPTGGHWGLLRSASRGWQMSGIVSAQTGLPFTPVLASDPTNTGTTARPNRIASGELPAGERDPQNWFDESAFVTPPNYTYGNSGRNILRGPGFSNVDLGLSRYFVVTEKLRLQFRAEAFNLLNSPQFGLPNYTLGQANTGAISKVIHPQRELQFALKLKF